MCFQRKVKNKPLEILIQPIVLHLVDFEKVLKSLTLFDFVVKQIKSIVSCFQSIVFLKNINIILLSGFNFF